MEFLTEPATLLAIGGILVGAASEVIGLNKKWQSNSVVQIIMAGLKRVFKVK